MIKEKILSSELPIESLIIMVFRYQATNNPVYKNYLSFLKINPDKVNCLADIPFLPVSFFKTHEVICNNTQSEKIFTSSGTTGKETSNHFVSSLAFYQKVFMKGFELFYGDIKNYVILALLPSYLERTGSSLVYMADGMIYASKNPSSGFFLHDLDKLYQLLQQLEKQKQKTILLGVTYALLNLAEKFPLPLSNTIIMETGGMKGKRKEMVREELHEILKSAFQVSAIHAEYGMTELLSQAYSKSDGLFQCTPWMQVIIKDIHDPLGPELLNKTGAINIVDLANIDSCSFIATQDLGKKYVDGSFEILGRFDNSDLRGCNLLIG